MEIRANEAISVSAQSKYAINSAASTTLDVGRNLLLEQNHVHVKISDKLTVDTTASIALSTNKNFLLSSTNDFDIAGLRREEINAGGDLTIDVDNGFILNSHQKSDFGYQK